MHYREKRREGNPKGEWRQRKKGICERERKEKERPREENWYSKGGQRRNKMERNAENESVTEMERRETATKGREKEREEFMRKRKR